MQLSKFGNVIILLILPIILSVSGTTNQLTIKDKASMISTSVPTHTNPKIEKKIKKLKKKLEKIKEKREKEPGRAKRNLVVLGLLTIIGGIVIFFTAGNTEDPLHDGGCLYLMIGAGIALLGLILVIIGALIKG